MASGAETHGHGPAASGAPSRASQGEKEGGSTKRPRSTGTSPQAQAASAATAERSDETSRAEKETDEIPAARLADEVLDQAGERLGRLLLAGSLRLQRGLALAIEEVEDIWAEAQSIRRGDRSNPD